MDNTKQTTKYLNPPQHLTKLFNSSTALVDVLWHLSGKSVPLNSLQSSLLQNLINLPLGPHVSSPVLWRERKITRADSGLPRSLDLLAEDRAPEAEWLPLIVLPIFFFFLLHLLLLAGVSLAAGGRLVLRELLDLKMVGEWPSLFHSKNNF